MDRDRVSGVGGRGSGGTHSVQEDQSRVGLSLKEHPHHVLVGPGSHVLQVLVDLRLDHCEAEASRGRQRFLPSGAGSAGAHVRGKGKGGGDAAG